MRLALAVLLLLGVLLGDGSLPDRFTIDDMRQYAGATWAAKGVRESDGSEETLLVWTWRDDCRCMDVPLTDRSFVLLVEYDRETRTTMAFLQDDFTNTRWPIVGRG